MLSAALEPMFADALLVVMRRYTHLAAVIGDDLIGHSLCAG